MLAQIQLEAAEMHEKTGEWPSVVILTKEQWKQLPDTPGQTLETEVMTGGGLVPYVCVEKGYQIIAYASTGEALNPRFYLNLTGE